MTIRDQLRAAIESSGKSAAQLARETGLTQTTITRFLQGTDIRLSAVKSLATYFGLELLASDATAAAKAKVKAPAMPAVDWAGAELKKKQKAEPPPGPPAKAPKRPK